jgi:hypothetical protein
LEKEADQIREEGIKMSWYMRGGMSYEQVMLLSSSERSMLSKLIKENLDTTKKTGLNFF